MFHEYQLKSNMLEDRCSNRLAARMQPICFLGIKRNSVIPFTVMGRVACMPIKHLAFDGEGRSGEVLENTKFTAVEKSLYC
jgi:hypothetical protein